MNFKPFYNAIPYIAAGLVFFMAFWGGMDIYQGEVTPALSFQ